MEECECSGQFWSPGKSKGVSEGCPNCGRPFRTQPSPIIPETDMAMKEMPEAAGDGGLNSDMSGNPLKEGILADNGWQNRNKRDEVSGSVNRETFNMEPILPWWITSAEEHNIEGDAEIGSVMPPTPSDSPTVEAKLVDGTPGWHGATTYVANMSLDDFQPPVVIDGEPYSQEMGRQLQSEYMLPDHPPKTFMISHPDPEYLDVLKSVIETGRPEKLRELLEKRRSIQGEKHGEEHAVHESLLDLPGKERTDKGFHEDNQNLSRALYATQAHTYGVPYLTGDQGLNSGINATHAGYDAGDTQIPIATSHPELGEILQRVSDLDSLDPLLDWIGQHPELTEDQKLALNWLANKKVIDPNGLKISAFNEWGSNQVGGGGPGTANRPGTMPSKGPGYGRGTGGPARQYNRPGGPNYDIRNNAEAPAEAPPYSQNSITDPNNVSNLDDAMNFNPTNQTTLEDWFKAPSAEYPEGHPSAPAPQAQAETTTAPKPAPVEPSAPKPSSGGLLDDIGNAVSDVATGAESLAPKALGLAEKAAPVAEEAAGSILPKVAPLLGDVTGPISDVLNTNPVGFLGLDNPTGGPLANEPPPAPTKNGIGPDSISPSPDQEEQKSLDQANKNMEQANNAINPPSNPLTGPVLPETKAPAPAPEPKNLTISPPAPSTTEQPSPQGPSVRPVPSPTPTPNAPPEAPPTRIPTPTPPQEVVPTPTPSPEVGTATATPGSGSIPVPTTLPAPHPQSKPNNKSPKTQTDENSQRRRPKLHLPDISEVSYEMDPKAPMEYMTHNNMSKDANTMTSFSMPNVSMPNVSMPNVSPSSMPGQTGAGGSPVPGSGETSGGGGAKTQALNALKNIVTNQPTYQEDDLPANSQFYFTHVKNAERDDANEHPSSHSEIPANDITDPDMIDPHQKKEDDDTNWQKDFSVNDIGGSKQDPGAVVVTVSQDSDPVSVDEISDIFGIEKDSEPAKLISDFWDHFMDHVSKPEHERDNNDPILSLLKELMGNERDNGSK